MTIRLHKNDLPNLSEYQDCTEIAIDTETLGLNPYRDRLCCVQISKGDGSCDIIQIAQDAKKAPHLCQLLEDENIIKIAHFARFDIFALYKTFFVTTSPIWCTKLASRLARTYTDRHGLKDLVKEYLDIDLSKQQQCSDWGKKNLSKEQLSYAAADVLHLHQIKAHLEKQLKRDERLNIHLYCCDFLLIRAQLDSMGWANEDIFAH